jgi:hypothetical protein
MKTYDSPDVDFSCNIEKVFYDSKELAEVLKTENNYVEKSWKTRIMIEYTPRGNVLMYYDAYKQAFAYYSDQTVIPYSVLNAAAMKYVSIYWCRDFFVDESIGTPSRLIQRDKPKENTTKPHLPSKTPFIKPKGYNASSAKTDIKNEKMTNKFVYLGKIVNFGVLSKSKIKNENNGFHTTLLSPKTLSYEEYKRQKASLSN